MAANFPLAFEISNDDRNVTRGVPSETAELVLGPFSRNPKLEFDGVEVGSEAVQKVILRNPTDAPQCVVVIPPKDFLTRGFSLNASEFEIPPYSKGELEIRFKPLKELHCRDTVYLQDKQQNLKFHFQLTSRAICKKMTVKRKRWNANKKPVVVPTSVQNLHIESLPPKTFSALPETTVEQMGGSDSFPLNVTTPVFSVAANSFSCLDGTYCVKPKVVREFSAVFDDSLEANQQQSETRRQVLFSFDGDSFTLDSVQLQTEVNKENTVQAGGDRRLLDLSFSDFGFDSFTPDRLENKRPMLKSIENLAHNTSTPKLPPLNIKTEAYDPSLIAKNPGTTTVSCRVEQHSATPCKASLPIKLEPVTPELGSSCHPFAAVNSAVVNVKNEPITSQAIDSDCTFKNPPAVCFKEELFTPIPQSDSLKKLAISFAVSPPKSSLRKNLFGSASTPRSEKPVVGAHCAQTYKMYQSVKQEPEDSSLPGSWNLSSCIANRLSVPCQPKRHPRGETLSPKSLIAFKKSVRVHVPRKNSASSQPGVEDLYAPGPVFRTDIYSGTVSDPFARGAIHPLEFLDKQGKELIKWMNSALTPPDEYSAYEAGVDVASLWKKSVASDNVPLPPSRETVSSKYHKNEMHLLNLRKTAQSIFRSRYITETLYKIFSKIDVGYISVKDDIDLHCDQGARCHLVQLLMYYNPLWLRIGLETIYNREIPLQPRQTVIGLMHFIKNHFLSDKYICEKNSFQNIHHLKMPKFKKEMNDFIIFKFFSLVFFLDVAKQKAIVPYDPCLFNRNSPIKESEEMINEFIKEFIKCVGHMKKNLATMGFVVSHKQTAIDEYEFAVHTHLDLRDGARLTRLIEIILQKKHLTKKLRLPAISRLQKVHNVKLAFSGLEEEGVTIVDVLPNDVVDGHREKILSLLWQILHKFLKPRMEKGAIVIQKWWRKASLKLEIERRVQRKKKAKRVAAAVKIQAHWRGYVLRKNYLTMKTDLEIRNRLCRLQRETASIKLQRWYRKTKQCKADQSALITRAALTIQLHYRAMVEGRKQREMFVQMRESAVVIQCWYRATAAMKNQKMEYAAKRMAVLTIQRHYRAMVERRKQREKFVQMRKSAVVIQRWYRGTAAMKNQKMEYGAKRMAVLTIQRHYRAMVEGRKQREKFVQMRESAVVIQRWYRATAAMKNQKVEYDTKRMAVLTIQRHYRAMVEGRKQREKFVQMRESAVVIQCWYRATAAMKNQKMEYAAKRMAVLTIQRHYRAMVEGRKQREKFIQMRKSAVAIQLWYRGTAAMKNQKMEYAAKRMAVLTIQRHYRAMVEGRKQREKFVQMRESAVVIQCWYRATAAMKNQKMEYAAKRMAVLTIQRHYRAMVEGRKQREKFIQMRKSAVAIQLWYRGTAAMKNQKMEYAAKRMAVLTIQRHYRAMVEGRRQREKFVQMRESAVVIQRWYRATAAMKNQKMEYDAKRMAASTIQQHYRAMVKGRKQWEKFVQMRESAVVIQRWYRATAAMKNQKMEYDAKRMAVLTIQRHYRAMVEGRRQREKFIQMRKSAVAIQLWYRGTAAMKNQKMEYAAKRMAVLTVQRHYRAMVEGRRQREKFVQMRESAVVIQRWYRATAAMKNQKMEYDAKRMAVLTIQRHYRAMVEGRKQREIFVRIRKSALAIQRWYHATAAMKNQKMEYDAKRMAALTIQQHYRAMVEGRRQREKFIQMRKSAVAIQLWYRGTAAMKNQKMEYAAKRMAVLTIQRHYRAMVEGRKQREIFVRIRKSAVAIQRWYRATAAMKNQKMEYDAKRIMAALTIQQHYRAMVEGRKQRKIFVRIRKSAVAIQRWYRGTAAMKNQKMEYDAKRMAALTIQQHYRAMVKGSKQREMFVQMRKSAVVIQRWYRATAAMKNQKMENDAKRMAVLTIQWHYRAMVEGRKQREIFVRIQKSAVAIQRWYRGTVAMKNQKMEYDAKRMAALTIQQHYRAMVEGRKQREKFVQMRKSAVVIQRWYRATAAMKNQKMEYDAKRMAVLTIQWHYRAMVEGRKQREIFVRIRKSAVAIQRWYRDTAAMKNQKMEYDAKRVAVLTIQRHYPAMVEGRKQREIFVRIRKSAVAIQRWYRGTAAMKNQKMEYDAKRRAALTIQRHYRAMVEGRKQREMYHLMRKSAVKIQRRWRVIMERRLLHDNNSEAATDSRVAVVRQGPTLQQNYNNAINFMMSPAVRTKLNRTYVAFKNLDFITQYSPALCEELGKPSSAPVYGVIYHFLDIASRSDAYQTIFGHGMNILLQLITYHKTYNAVWENTMKYNGINVLLNLQGKFLEKNEVLFCRAATIIWLLSRSPEQVERIKSSTDIDQRMTYFAKKVLSKCSSSRNQKSRKHQPVLPNLVSNWGYSRGVTGHKEFPTRVYAVSAILNQYHLEI